MTEGYQIYSFCRNAKSGIRNIAGCKCHLEIVAQKIDEKRRGYLDRLIAVFDEADIRPEIRDELWNAIGINVEINFPSHTCLPIL